MYFCRLCFKKFHTEEELVKHFMSCWKQKNPSHKSTEAKRSEEVETRKINSDMENFFNSLIERKE